MEDPQDTRVIISSNNNQLQKVPTNDEVPVDIPAQTRCIYRVPIHMREDRNRKMYEYDPVVVSLGPYHHGNPKYSRIEKFKKVVLSDFVRRSVADDATKDRDFFYNKILERINEIRANYEEVDEYDNEALAEIILCDACFLLCYMDVHTGKTSSVTTYKQIIDELGWSTLEFVVRDVRLLENQIPFWVIKHLFYLRFGENKANEFVHEYLRESSLDMNRITNFPWEDEGESQPLHILEARRITLLTQDTTPAPCESATANIILIKCKEYCKSCWISNHNSDHINPATYWDRPYRSVTYLQAKGIYFRPKSECLRDITFTSYHFYGVLRLPILLISPDTNVLFQNVIAFEMSPKDSTDGAMQSYITFMKSLIGTAKDVKELRERGIIYSSLGSDEEVVKMFKEMNTFGLNYSNIFEDVRRQIEKHCNSKAKTWIADLYHNYCWGPWAAIAILAASAVLCLTFLQTYYTIHPISKI